MQNHVYTDYPQLEEKHWWYAARRKLINRLIRLYQRKGQRRWLDAGCGTGGNLRSLKGPPIRMGIDFTETALQRGLDAYRLQDEQTGQPVQWVCGDVGLISLRNNTIDMITCLDVLEHLPDDTRTVAEFYRILAPNGLAILTVPAHPWLWSSLDRVALHYRRYTPDQLHILLRSVNWEILEWGSYNTFLFPLVALVRLLQRITERIFSIQPRQGAPRWVVGPDLGKWFHSLFVLEHQLARWIPRGFGISLYAVCRKVVRAEIPASTLQAPSQPVKSRTGVEVPINVC